MMIKNKPISKSNRWLIAFGCVVIVAALTLTAWLKNDSLWFLASGVVGIPLLLMSMSLFFGRASKNKGLFSPLILNFIGIMICIVYGLFLLNGEFINPIIIIVPIALFGLAATRKKK